MRDEHSKFYKVVYKRNDSGEVEKVYNVMILQQIYS